jgi:hypothetical protein
MIFGEAVLFELHNGSIRCGAVLVDEENIIFRETFFDLTRDVLAHISMIERCKKIRTDLDNSVDLRIRSEAAPFVPLIVKRKVTLVFLNEAICKSFLTAVNRQLTSWNEKNEIGVIEKRPLTIVCDTNHKNLSAQGLQLDDYLKIAKVVVYRELEAGQELISLGEEFDSIYEVCMKKIHLFLR